MEMQTRDINELLELRISIVTQAEDTRRENDLMMLNLKGTMNENNALFENCFIVIGTMGL
jgi:hypothetical protein